MAYTNEMGYAFGADLRRFPNRNDNNAYSYPNASANFNAIDQGRQMNPSQSPMADRYAVPPPPIAPLQGPVAYPGQEHRRGYTTESDDSQQDFVFRRRATQIIIDGRPYPTLPPDASTLARPEPIDWSSFGSPVRPAQPPAVHNTLPVQDMSDLHPGLNPVDVRQPRVSSGSAAQQAGRYSKSNKRNSGGPANSDRSAWSPYHPYPNAPPLTYRAPIVSDSMLAAYLNFPTPFDPFRKQSHVDKYYVCQAAAPFDKELINPSLSYWYAEQVLDLLIKPGNFRAGMGGSADDEWSSAGRERDALLRIGITPPQYKKPWGRVGMPTPKTPAPVPQPIRQRFPESEIVDPWDVVWQNSPQISPEFVVFVADLIQRMALTPTAVVSALWFLQGLGLHEGDGRKGTELRGMLKKVLYQEFEGVQRRVVTLGLMLAGKWLDDNSYLTKSWYDVTGISAAELHQLEQCALADLHYSLFVPAFSWTDHVNKQFAAIDCKGHNLIQMDMIMLTLLDQMVYDARKLEIDNPLDTSLARSRPRSPPGFERRYSYEAVSAAAANQLFTRSWDDLCDNLPVSLLPATDDAPGFVLGPSGYVHASRLNNQLGGASSNISAISANVGGHPLDQGQLGEGEEDEEEEFLDYDGAKRWLPSMSELRRSASNSSEARFYFQQQLNAHIEAENKAAEEASTLWDLEVQTKSWLRDMNAAGPLPPDSPNLFNRSLSSIPSQPSQTALNHAAHAANMAMTSAGQASLTTVSQRSQDVPPPMEIKKNFRETGIDLEPGISIVRPATGYLNLNLSSQTSATNNTSVSGPAHQTDAEAGTFGAQGLNNGMSGMGMYSNQAGYSAGGGGGSGSGVGGGNTGRAGYNGNTGLNPITRLRSSFLPYEDHDSAQIQKQTQFQFQSQSKYNFNPYNQTHSHTNNPIAPNPTAWLWA